MHPSVKQADFLTQSRETLNLSNKIVFGNPPYGIQGSVYSKFIKQSFNLGAKYVAFLLPAGSLTFNKIKHIDYEILYAEEVNTVFYTPQENKTYNKTPVPFFLVIYENKPLNSSRDKVLEEGKFDFTTASYIQGHDRIYFKKTTPEWNDFLQLDFFNLSCTNIVSIKIPNNKTFKFFKILDKKKFNQNYKFYLQLSSLTLYFIPSNETVNYWFKHHSKIKMIDSFKYTRLLEPGFEQTPISHYIQKSQETSRKL